MGAANDVGKLVELSDFIASLRGELVKAQQRANEEDAPIRFGVEGIELEFELSVAKEVEAGASGTAKLNSGKSLLKHFIGQMDAR